MMKSYGKDHMRCGLIAAVIAIAIGIVFFYGPKIARAVGSNTTTQVTVSFYTGIPSSLTSYADAYSAGDPGVNQVTYETKSIGRLQWGEPSAVGTYDVYYDAGDVHTLAANLNATEEQYLELYDKYVECYEAVMQ